MQPQRDPGRTVSGPGGSILKVNSSSQGAGGGSSGKATRAFRASLQVLGPGRRARPPKLADVAPWTKVETPGVPGRALSTFVSYSGSYAFSRGGGGS